MGGGDLNQKKSWHPSTMKNMERVWKAEQQDGQEKKRIAELQHELALERDREDMKSLAMEHGTIEKKEDKKLDWMYKKPNETINRDEYLLGRPVDKQFEQMHQAEKVANQDVPPKNHVEHECIPPSIRFFTGDTQVDLQRKLQEDPLYAIKKKQMETRAQLLKNPVKLKHLQQLAAQQAKEERKQKKHSKKRKSESCSEDSDTELNKLLADKFKKLKSKISEEDIIKSIKKHKKNKKSKKSYDEKHSKKKDREHKHIERCTDQQIDKHSKNYKHYSSDEEGSKSKTYGLQKVDGTKLLVSKKRSMSPEKSKKESIKSKNDQKWIPPKKQKLTEEEKEKRRQEMMVNASERDKERAKNVKRFEEQERKESKLAKKPFDKEFLQRQLALATKTETVASRIKSNINHIQRHKHSMDNNFVRR